MVEVAHDNSDVILDARQALGARVVAELEVGDVDVDHAIEQVERFGGAMEIRLPHDRRQVRAVGHQLEQRGQVNRRFAADPLDVSCSLVASPGDQLVE